MSKSERTYFDPSKESDIAALAAYIGVSVPEFHAFRCKGRFGVEPRAKDPTPVYHQSDIDQWLVEGRPVASHRLRRA